jgi:hypothetical protein
MGSHSTEVCEHGFKLRRCRCMGPHTTLLVPCPKVGNSAYRAHAEFVAALEAWVALNPEKDVLGQLKAELSKAFDETENLHLELEHAVNTTFVATKLKESRGYLRGITKAIEIVEAAQ